MALVIILQEMTAQSHVGKIFNTPVLSVSYRFLLVFYLSGGTNHGEEKEISTANIATFADNCDCGFMLMVI